MFLNILLTIIDQVGKRGLVVYLLKVDEIMQV